MKKILSILILSMMLLTTIGMVSAVPTTTTMTVNPDYAYCNMDGSDSSGVCTPAVSTDGGTTKTLDDNEIVDVRWLSSTVNLPSGASITSVKVFVDAIKKDENFVKIEKWDGTDLTPSQS